MTQLTIRRNRAILKPLIFLNLFYRWGEVDGDFSYFRRGFLGGDSLHCSQRELRRELATDMPAVR